MIHYRTVGLEILRLLTKEREFDMAPEEGYIELLATCGHTEKLHIIHGKGMNDVRLKAAKFIFEQKIRLEPLTRMSRLTLQMSILMILMMTAVIMQDSISFPM